jgi:hypothetical protein
MIPTESFNVLATVLADRQSNNNLRTVMRSFYECFRAQGIKFSYELLKSRSVTLYWNVLQFRRRKAGRALLRLHCQRAARQRPAVAYTSVR